MQATAMTSFIQRKQQLEKETTKTSPMRTITGVLPKPTSAKGCSRRSKRARPSIEADLKRSISLDEQIKKFAFDDEDFESVKGEVWFKQLTES